MQQLERNIDTRTDAIHKMNKDLNRHIDVSGLELTLQQIEVSGVRTDLLVTYQDVEKIYEKKMKAELDKLYKINLDNQGTKKVPESKYLDMQ